MTKKPGSWYSGPMCRTARETTTLRRGRPLRASSVTVLVDRAITRTHSFSLPQTVDGITITLERPQQIMLPADNFEAREAIRAAATAKHPVYVRFGKAPMYDLHAPGTKFEMANSITLREGNDVAFIGSGETVVHCLVAAEKLAEQGLDCGVISMLERKFF